LPTYRGIRRCLERRCLEGKNTNPNFEKVKKVFREGGVYFWNSLFEKDHPVILDEPSKAEGFSG
jgi:hypothetical protein